MTLPAPTYDLVILLDPQVEESARAKIVADTRSSIEGQGELLRHDEWGERPLSFPIEKRTSAEYHLLQFHAGAPELLSGLDRTLRITDGLLRFRIIKLKPGVPDAPDMGSAAARPAESEAGASSDVASTPPPPAPAAATEIPPAETPAAEAPSAETPAAEATPAELTPAEATPAQAAPAADPAPAAEPPAAEPASGAGEQAGEPAPAE